MKFTFKKEDSRGESTVVFEGEELEEVVDEFEKFLRASGFDLKDYKFALVSFNEQEFTDELEKFFEELGIDGQESDDDDSGERH